MNRQSPASMTDDLPALIPRPISVRIPVAVQMTGISRSKLYELIKSGELQIAKVGSSTLILVDSLERLIDAHRRL